MNPVTHFDLESAAALPANILFGTSSWNYPGWQGQIYHREYKNEKEFKAQSLAEYVAFPWFRTVGIDSFFYGPPHKTTLQRYSEQVPKDFRWVSKVWEQITIPQYAKHKRYGAKAGQANPNFLNAELFRTEVLAKFEVAQVEQHCGPFVFQFQTLGLDWTSEPQIFFDKLDVFFNKLPKSWRYAVEIRNPEFLVSEYFHLLNSNGVTHCFNHWTRMPALVDQMKAAASAGGMQADFYVARILTPHGVSYAEAVKRFQPYREIVAPLPGMRRDLQRLAQRALKRNATVFIIVNNRAEGNAPGTIDAVGSAIVRNLKM